MKTLTIVFYILALVAGPARGNIISYLRFEEGSGAYAADQTGLMNGTLLGGWSSFNPGGGDIGHDGWSTNVYSPTVPQTGDANTGSLKFSSGGFVNLSNPNHVNLGTGFTLEFFLRVVSGGFMYGFSPVNVLNGSLGFNETGDLFFGHQFQSSILIASADMVHLDQWQHYALVKQPGEYSIYIDGNLQFNGALPAETDGPYFFFGTDISGDRAISVEPGSWCGWLDEFRISDEALTPDRFLCAVPEPGTMGLLALGGLFAWQALRRRKSSL